MATATATTATEIVIEQTVLVPRTNTISFELGQEQELSTVYFTPHRVHPVSPQQLSRNKFDLLVKCEREHYSVAVLVHSRYGAAPYFGAHRMNRCILEAYSDVYEGHKSIDDFKTIVNEVLGRKQGTSEYIDDKVFNGLEVQFVSLGETFSVDEYDGIETIRDGNEYDAF